MIEKNLDKLSSPHLRKGTQSISSTSSCNDTVESSKIESSLSTLINSKSNMVSNKSSESSESSSVYQVKPFQTWEVSTNSNFDDKKINFLDTSKKLLNLNSDDIKSLSDDKLDSQYNKNNSFEINNTFSEGDIFNLSSDSHANEFMDSTLLKNEIINENQNVFQSPITTNYSNNKNSCINSEPTNNLNPVISKYTYDDIKENYTTSEIDNKNQETLSFIGKRKSKGPYKIATSLIYQIRPVSKLDCFSVSSSISQSEFIGFANLFVIISIFYIFCNPIIRWYEKKQLFDNSLAIAMFGDFFFLMLMWLKLAAWSFTALGLHVLLLKKKISSRTLTILQHITQAIGVLYPVYQCLNKKWPIIPAGFIQILSLVFFMKMHSYTETNKNFYKNYIKDSLGKNNEYPSNITFLNYWHYLLTPVLVYDLKFPTGHGFRLGYFISKIFALFGAMILMYISLTCYITPIIMKSPDFSVLQTLSKLILPLLSIDLIVFYIIFECVCNLFAEITNFGDREFYLDWWNSTCWDEFSRKWNRPVHKFLLKHIYLDPQEKYEWSARDASVATFVFSALLHEMIMVVCFRIIRMYLFFFMLLQIPLIALGKYYRGTNIGNYIFWALMMIGLPLLAVLYGREWAIHQQQTEVVPMRIF